MRMDTDIKTDMAWKAIGDITRTDSFLASIPSVGKRVRSLTQRGKNAGKEGTVFWHGRDPYQNPYRYCSPMQAALRAAMGRYGFRVGVLTDTGERFFVPADKVEVQANAASTPTN